MNDRNSFQSIGQIGYPVSGNSSMGSMIWDHENADHRRAFATALAPLVAVLWKRKEPFGRTDAMIYMRTLRNVPSAILVEAVERILAKEAWFPEPAKLLTHAADVIDERRAEARLKWLWDDCEDCAGSRWREITIDGVARLERCGCWQRAMQAMNEAGQPIQRPSLPAHTEPEPMA